MQDNRIVASYYNLPVAMMNQIKKLALVLGDDPKVLATYEYNIDKFRLNTPKGKEVAMGLAIMHAISTAKLLRKAMFSHIYAFDTKGNYVRLEKIISSGDHVCLVSGQLYTAKEHKYPVVVKWYNSRSRDIIYELDIYRGLRTRGCPIPWVATEFFLWTNRVLIMEKLVPLCAKDNEFVMGIQILQQFRFVHKFGVHCDVKPGNIMRREHRGSLPLQDDVTLISEQNDFDFFLIDHGGDSLIPCGYGYERHCWTPRWCSQARPRRGEKQITTAKNDFLELGYTMKTFHCWRTGQKQVKNKNGEYIKDPYRTNFTGILGEYMDYVNAIDPTKISMTVHADLIQILMKALKR